MYYYYYYYYYHEEDHRPIYLQHRSQLLQDYHASGAMLLCALHEDQYWDHDNSYRGDHWGSKEWWTFDTRDDDDNWFSANRNENRVDKKTRRKGEMKWSGHEWRTM